jgi:hypothetical protein
MHPYDMFTVGVGTVPTDVTEGVQVLNLGYESVVDVSTRRTKASAITKNHPIRAQQDGRNTAEFLNEVRALARRRRSTRRTQHLAAQPSRVAVRGCAADRCLASSNGCTSLLTGWVDD